MVYVLIISGFGRQQSGDAAHLHIIAVILCNSECHSAILVCHYCLLRFSFLHIA